MVENNIQRLIEKIDTIEDKELIELIKNLIEERNYLSEVANIDTLTGLNNRRVLSRIRNYSGILLLDVDNFKTINDTYGHSTGDYVLKKIAEILKNNTRASDYVCRYGGDEFVCVFEDCPEEIMKKRAEEIRTLIEQETELSHHNVTASIGIAFQNEESIEDLIKKADEGLYDAKRSGKNQVSEYQQQAKNPTSEYFEEVKNER